MLHQFRFLRHPHAITLEFIPEDEENETDEAFTISMDLGFMNTVFSDEGFGHSISSIMILPEGDSGEEHTEPYAYVEHTEESDYIYVPVNDYFQDPETWDTVDHLESGKTYRVKMWILVSGQYQYEYTITSNKVTIP